MDFEYTSSMNTNIPGRERFEQAYEGKPPWDIGKPQPVIVRSADKVAGSVIDVGCGTGENALFFAERGHDVVGIDFLEKPIAEARRKAAERGLSARFLVHDALQLDTLPDRFDSAIDCGLFHVFADDDRARYVSGLATIIRPGGKLILLCFSDKEPPGDGPRRITEQELRAAFANDWEIESLEEAQFEVRPDLEDIRFSEGGPYAWLGVIRRR